ncbi:Kinesin-related 6 [Gossypium arboreum]|uniref:Kinesin-like protein n=1 Tax=Gossypium arboreum TaxID=29729 RepID=A0A0B0MM93_GOSAR|nr:Kinesin-related 6 [Gossypium arboreum]
MNGMGRQGKRSGAAGLQVHHQRQHSDNFLETTSNGRWLQSAGLQHLHSSNNSIPPLQDYAFYGGGDGGGQGSRMYRNMQREFNMGNDFFTEPTTPPVGSRPSSQRMNGDQSPNEFSPGLLDLHSFDTELLPEVRKRPLNKKELAKNEEDIIETLSNSLVVHETKLKVDLTEYMEKHEFVFDAVLNEEVSNDEPLPLKASRDILRLMHHTYRNQGFHLFVSFFEIYGGKLYDLLSDRKKLCMREDGKQQVCIVGLQEFRVSDVETIKELIEKGNATRSTGTTGANEESSRSHAILQLAIKRSVDGKESKPPRVVGKLSFIDLAGSERGADTTDNDKQTRMEGAEINKSLLALKECIRALDNDQGHIPFRGSKLTEVLRDSFMGNSRTVMISCISPSSGSCEHTLNTLRYADRVKSLSKGGNSKKDVLSSTMNLKESTAQPLSSVLPTASTFEDDINNTWPDQNERDDFNVPEDSFEQEILMWKKNGKLDQYGFSTAVENKLRKPNGQTKWKEPVRSDIKHSKSDDDLNALLQEEEDLVNAHRKQVEETMNIVKEEMNLLVEADQPGNQLDDYISRLTTILSQKAAGITQLQTRLANFQRRLKEHNVLVSSSGY